MTEKRNMSPIGLMAKAMYDGWKSLRRLGSRLAAHMGWFTAGALALLYLIVLVPPLGKRRRGFGRQHGWEPSTVSTRDPDVFRGQY